MFLQMFSQAFPGQPLALFLGRQYSLFLGHVINRCGETPSNQEEENTNHKKRVHKRQKSTQTTTTSTLKNTKENGK